MNREEILNKLIELGILETNGSIKNHFLITRIKNIEYFQTSEGETYSEKLYLFIKDISKPLCPVCHKNKLKFINTVEGYRKTCSSKCSNNSSERLKKSKETCLKKYGNASYRNREQYKKTNLEKFGHENPNSSPEIKEKKLNTYREKYGVDNPSKIPEVIKIKKDTHRKKYFESLLNGTRLHNQVEPLFTEEEYSTIEKKYRWKCSKCSTEFEDHLMFGKIPTCPKCFNRYTPISKVEKEVSQWLKSLNIEVIENSKRIIPPKEVDIYLPQYNIAIEVNGLYWHSELHGKKNSKYHQKKLIDCNEKGITLLQIWDIEWNNKNEIVKNIILNKLDLLKPRKIGARECKIREVSVEESRAFLEKNHLQGFTGASKHLGLYYNDILVSYLSYGFSRFHKERIYEIFRYAIDPNYSITGGFSRLLKQLPEGRVVTYSDARFFNGNIYESSGFKRIKLSTPGYYYTRNYSMLESRFKFQKKNLPNKELTEWENMQILNYDRVWDCGNWVFIKT